jgi:hypothetical protein
VFFRPLFLFLPSSCAPNPPPSPPYIYTPLPPKTSPGERSYLSFKRVDSIIVQFIKTHENRALLGKFVWAYFGRMCGCCSCGGTGQRDDVDVDDVFPVMSNCSEHATDLIRVITRPNFDSLPFAGSSGRKRRRRRCNCSLPPLYLQWEGHSVTVVGIRKTDENPGSGKPPSFALVIFCPQRNVADTKGALAREFASLISDDAHYSANDTTARSITPSVGGKGRAMPSVIELHANKLLQKDCQILLSTARVIDKGESHRRKFCSSNLGFVNAVSMDDSF